MHGWVYTLAENSCWGSHGLIHGWKERWVGLLTEFYGSKHNSFFQMFASILSTDLEHVLQAQRKIYRKREIVPPILTSGHGSTNFSSTFWGLWAPCFYGNRYKGMMSWWCKRRCFNGRHGQLTDCECDVEQETEVSEGKRPFQIKTERLVLKMSKKWMKEDDAWRKYSTEWWRSQ